MHWLKEHNPKYYGSIEISEAHMQRLPEDDVPEELTSIIRHSEDVGVIEEESNRYVPQDDNEGEYMFCLIKSYLLKFH